MTLSEKETSLINDPNKWVNVESSNLKAVLYIPGEKSRGRLFVKFNKGDKVYFYEEVPKKIYKAFLEAESKGHYLNENIKPNYTCYSIK